MRVRSIVSVAALSLSLLLSLTLAPSALAQSRRGGMNRRPPRPEKPQKPARTPLDEFQKMSP
ncbi:MAG TPA: hypothetical protein VGV35_14595, partial [Bryobacteraceae bacterium]|nr:hypothetical protein [Bryobacteraceae bacterium]